MFTSGNKDTNYGIDPFSNFFYIPSPLCPPYNGVLMELEDQGLLLLEEHENGLFQPMANSACDESISAETVLNMVDSAEKYHHQAVYHELIRSNEEEQVVRRRSSKRDRHSKINTARGPRDRRMRLSLKVAREFFYVQDMLGFDKGSKTLEWLLIQSKPSIDKLFAGVPSQMTMNYSWKSVSSPSECEVISGLDEAGLIAGSSPNGTSKTSSKIKKLRRTRSSSSGRILQKPLARESRAKARARARERTSEKKKLSEEASNRWSNPNLLGSCWSSAFGTGEDQYSSSPKHAFNHNMNRPPLPHPPPPSSDVLGKANERIREKQGRLEAATGCFIDDSLVITSNWNPSSIPMSHLQSTSNIPHETSNLCARIGRRSAAATMGHVYHHHNLLPSVLQVMKVP